MCKFNEFTDDYRINVELLREALYTKELPSIWIEVDDRQYRFDRVMVKKFIDNDGRMHSSITLRGE